MAGIPQVITEDRASGAQVVEGSLRFDGSKSQYLKRTFSSGNGKTWTWSAWVKKHSVGTDRRLFASDADSSNQGAFKFIGDQIQFFFRTSGNFDINLYTEAFFRDTGWYHMMAVVDTTIASPSTDRVKLYVNGVLQTISSSYNTYPSENYQTRINSNVEHSIGRYISNGSQNINDSLSQVYFLDGQALGPENFGYTDPLTNTWRPKKFIATGPNNGTTWSGNVTSSNFASGSATNVFDGNFYGSQATINSSDASNNHITLSSVNVVASKVGVVLSNSGSDIQVYVNGSLVGTAAAGDIINNNPKHFEFTFTETTVSTIKVQRGSSTSGWQIYGVSLNGIILIDGDVSNVGRNGFKLDFRDFTGDTATTIGRDYSGNGNNFSPDNFGGTGDGAIDSPTNNFTSFNKIMDYSLNADITEAGLRVEGPDSGHNDRRIYAPFDIPLTGKYYVEVKFVKNGARGTIGFSDGAINGGGNGSNWFSFGFYGGGYSTSFTKVGSNTSDFNLNDYVSFALDMDAGKMWLVKNGNVDVTAQESITGIIRTNLDRPLRWFYQETASDESAALFNFGQFPYNYTVPDGFKTLSSRNIQPTYFDATNQPVKTFLNPKNHFDSILYTGNSSNQTVTGLQFQPDFAWIKNRSDGHHSSLTDSVRGMLKTLSTSRTDIGEYSESAGLNSFLSNGLGFNGNNYFSVNIDTKNFVAWCWKAGGTAVSNTDGDITSSVSVNKDAGFSIATYTGSTANGALTVGHGLGKKPAMVIIRRTDAGADWIIGHKGLATNAFANNKFLKFDTSATSTNSVVFGVEPTTTVTQIVTDGNAGAANLTSSGTYVMYSWAEIPGFSKFDSYIGNGSTNGVYVHLGFRPAWIMLKRIDSTTGAHWLILDNKRNPYNPINRNLYGNLNNDDGTTDRCDFLANGFKIKNNGTTINADGGTYIYMAIAEQPGITTYGSSPTAR